MMLKDLLCGVSTISCINIREKLILVPLVLLVPVLRLVLRPLAHLGILRKIKSGTRFIKLSERTR